jgi:hypothetical protein
VETDSTNDPPVRTTEVAGIGDESSAVLLACQEALKRATLHLVSRCTDGEIVFMADCFDDESLQPFFTQINADIRRKFYLAHAREIGSVATTLGRTMHTALGGGLVLRMVLDVEQGSIFYYRLRPGDYLVGVTVDPAKVSRADDEMARLTDTVTGLLDQ